jgi:YVTN family beta-propeller protein
MVEASVSFSIWLVIISITQIKRKHCSLLVLSLGVTIIISLVVMACNNVTAQTLETITKKRKAFENNPQIEVGSKPGAIAVNPQTNKIYVVNSGESTVSVIDSNSGNIAKKIPVGISPTSIAVDTSGNKIYVANQNSSTVSVIDGYNDSEITKIRVGYSPQDILFDSNSHTLYVADSNGSVYVISTLSNRVTTNSAIGGRPIALAGTGLQEYFLGGGNFPKIWVASISDGTVRVINALTNKPEAYIKLGPEAAPVSMASDSYYSGDHFPKIFVANNNYGNISVINALNNTVVANITLEKGNTPSYITYDPKHDGLYVTDSKHNIVYVINGTGQLGEFRKAIGRVLTLRDIRVLTLRENISSPSYIDFDPENSPGVIYVANSGGNTVSEISTATGAYLRSISVGENPGYIAHNTKTGMFYVSNRASNTVSVINGFSSKVAAGVTFNVNPGNSGQVTCNNKEYPTNTYVFIDVGTKCTAQPHKDFEFDRWVENLNRNSTLPLNTSAICKSPLDSFLCNLGIRPPDDPSAAFDVTRYGTFTANFKPLPPAIPPEYLYLVISVIVSSIIGWSIPSIFGRAKTRAQLRHLEECINQIGKLDKNVIEDKIEGYYVSGKISEDHRKYLKDKISEYYDG